MITNRFGVHTSQGLDGVMDNTNIKLNDVIGITHIKYVLPSRWQHVHHVIDDELELEGEVDELLSSTSFPFCCRRAVMRLFPAVVVYSQLLFRCGLFLMLLHRSNG